MKKIPYLPNCLHYHTTQNVFEFNPFAGISDPSRKQMYGNNLEQKVVADKQPPIYPLTQAP